jgi:hypothetical protein
MKIEIEIELGFSQDNYTALKTMLDAYIGEYIKENTVKQSHYTQFQGMVGADLNFTISFEKTPPMEQLV